MIIYHNISFVRCVVSFFDIQIHLQLNNGCNGWMVEMIQSLIQFNDRRDSALVFSALFELDNKIERLIF